jgi:hypothetical protein
MGSGLVVLMGSGLCLMGSGLCPPPPTAPASAFQSGGLGGGRLEELSRPLPRTDRSRRRQGNPRRHRRWRRRGSSFTSYHSSLRDQTVTKSEINFNSLECRVPSLACFANVTKFGTRPAVLDGRENRFFTYLCRDVAEPVLSVNSTSPPLVSLTYIGLVASRLGARRRYPTDFLALTVRNGGLVTLSSETSGRPGP